MGLDCGRITGYPEVDLGFRKEQRSEVGICAGVSEKTRLRNCDAKFGSSDSFRVADDPGVTNPGFTRGLMGAECATARLYGDV
jgi:hypothetical protein